MIEGDSGNDMPFAVAAESKNLRVRCKKVAQELRAKGRTRSNHMKTKRFRRHA
jgi:hypothetical protein